MLNIILLPDPGPFSWHFSLPETTTHPSFSPFHPPSLARATSPFPCPIPFPFSSLTFKFTFNVRGETFLSQHPIYILEKTACFVLTCFLGFCLSPPLQKRHESEDKCGCWLLAYPAFVTFRGFQGIQWYPTGHLTTMWRSPLQPGIKLTVNKGSTDPLTWCTKSRDICQKCLTWIQSWGHNRTNPSLGLFCKIAGLDSSQVSLSQGKTMQNSKVVFLVKGAWGTSLSELCNSGLDSR